MAWPKGVPRGKRNIDPTLAVNPYQKMETMSHVAQPREPDGQANQDASPHLLENKLEQRPYHDNAPVMDAYLQHLGVKTEEDTTTDQGLEGQPPAEQQDTAVKTSDAPLENATIEVKKDEPVTAQTESTPVQQTAVIPQAPATPPVEKEKYLTKEEAERGAKEAERKMHEALQERSRLEAENKTKEAFIKQMLEVVNAMKGNQSQPQQATPPAPEEVELTPEQKTELIINNPDEYERLMLEKAERRIMGKWTAQQQAEQAQIEQESKQRGIQLFIKMGEQHFENAHQDMKIYEPYVKEESEKLLKSPDARELISQKGPQGLIDKAVENTKIRIEQIRATLMAGTTPPQTPPAPGNGGEVRTPIPAAPVVTPHGILPVPPKPSAPVPPTPEQRAKDYVADREAWRAQRGLS